ncbi:MAG TPA: hypothetical protein H9670_04390 [Firmicutes bacterium]|nr:hypothetical protein [Bacillota bacterium]
MTRQKKVILALLVAFVFFLGTTLFCGVGLQASAEEVPSDGVEEIIPDATEEDITTRGLFTSLSLSIQGGNGKIWTTVKNDITIFPATVYVIVELYVSPTYQEKHEDMTLIAVNSTMDLNMGETITAEASTGGVQQYWQGRMRYKVDNKAWEVRDTGTYLYSADGTFLDII